MNHKMGACVGTVTITRGGGYFDWLRAYRLLIDGQQWALIRVRESVSLELPPGQYSLEARIDWCRSEVLHIDIRELQMTTIAVQTGNPFLILTPILGYIKLSESEK